MAKAKHSPKPQYTKAQIERWKQKAARWDKLADDVSKYYCNKDGEIDEENPEKKGDLIDIGEVAAMALGWL